MNEDIEEVRRKILDADLEFVFVFGSNLAGRHGAGSALEAMKYHGAVYGVGRGRTGNSYAIPTKDFGIRTLPLEIIALHIEEFLRYAKIHEDILFIVTRIGCGLAGYKDEDIAPMFKDAPLNCSLPSSWMKINEETQCS